MIGLSLEAPRQPRVGAHVGSSLGGEAAALWSTGRGGPWDEVPSVEPRSGVGVEIGGASRAALRIVEERRSCTIPRRTETASSAAIMTAAATTITRAAA